MSLKHIQIHYVRNINPVAIDVHPHFNLICGPNGSGKTSILEAIYLLSHGRSFRTRHAMPLIQHKTPSMTVYAQTDRADSISIQKNTSGLTQVQLNQKPCVRSSDLALFLPCQVFYADIFQIIDAGPSVRRSLLDWGLFHVKQDYHPLFIQYRRVIKQRNAALRDSKSYRDCALWDQSLVPLAEQLHALRAAYFDTWATAFTRMLEQLTDLRCEINYFKGWDKRESNKSLAQILEEQWPLDRQRLYTQSGAHQADIIFTLSSLQAKQSLSRGQQKIILIALKLAQAQLLSQPCVYLLDDITSELDEEHTQRLMACLTAMKGQFFLTHLDEKQTKSWQEQIPSYRFQIKNGELTCFT